MKLKSNSMETNVKPTSSLNVPKIDYSTLRTGLNPHSKTALKSDVNVNPGTKNIKIGAQSSSSKVEEPSYSVALKDDRFRLETTKDTLEIVYRNVRLPMVQDPTLLNITMAFLLINNVPLTTNELVNVMTQENIPVPTGLNPWESLEIKLKEHLKSSHPIFTLSQGRYHLLHLKPSSLTPLASPSGSIKRPWTPELTIETHPLHETLTDPMIVVTPSANPPLTVPVPIVETPGVFPQATVNWSMAISPALGPMAYPPVSLPSLTGPMVLGENLYSMDELDVLMGPQIPRPLSTPPVISPKAKKPKSPRKMVKKVAQSSRVPIKKPQVFEQVLQVDPNDDEMETFFEFDPAAFEEEDDLELPLHAPVLVHDADGDKETDDESPLSTSISEQMLDLWSPYTLPRYPLLPSFAHLGNIWVTRTQDTYFYLSFFCHDSKTNVSFPFDPSLHDFNDDDSKKSIRFIPLLRRVDNNIVNASTLLYAAGVTSVSEQSIALSMERIKVRIKQLSVLYGTWVSLYRAQTLAESCCLLPRLETFLNDELKLEMFDVPLIQDKPASTPEKTPSNQVNVISTLLAKIIASNRDKTPAKNGESSGASKSPPSSADISNAARILSALTVIQARNKVSGSPPNISNISNGSPNLKATPFNGSPGVTATPLFKSKAQMKNSREVFKTPARPLVPNSPQTPSQSSQPHANVLSYLSSLLAHKKNASNTAEMLSGSPNPGVDKTQWANLMQSANTMMSKPLPQRVGKPVANPVQSLMPRFKPPGKGTVNVQAPMSVSSVHSELSEVVSESEEEPEPEVEAKVIVRPNALDVIDSIISDEEEEDYDESDLSSSSQSDSDSDSEEEEFYGGKRTIKRVVEELSDSESEVSDVPEPTAVKRGRGRPPKVQSRVKKVERGQVKRGRGRPRKHARVL